MLLKTEWKIAKWLNRHGPVCRTDIPKWFPAEMAGTYQFFRVVQTNTNELGELILSDYDEFLMTDRDRDAFYAEQKRRIHSFRDWMEPIGVVVATIISLIALIVSITAIRLELQSKATEPKPTTEAQQAIRSVQWPYTT